MIRITDDTFSSLRGSVDLFVGADGASGKAFTVNHREDGKLVFEREVLEAHQTDRALGIPINVSYSSCSHADNSVNPRHPKPRSSSSPYAKPSIYSTPPRTVLGSSISASLQTYTTPLPLFLLLNVPSPPSLIRPTLFIHGWYRLSTLASGCMEWI